MPQSNRNIIWDDEVQTNKPAPSSWESRIIWDDEAPKGPSVLERANQTPIWRRMSEAGKALTETADIGPALMAGQPLEAGKIALRGLGAAFEPIFAPWGEAGKEAARGVGASERTQELVGLGTEFIPSVIPLAGASRASRAAEALGMGTVYNRPIEVGKGVNRAILREAGDVPGAVPPAAPAAPVATVKPTIKATGVPKAVKAAEAVPEQVLKPVEAAKPVVQAEGNIAAGGLAHGQPLPKYAASINLERVGADYSVKKLLLDTSDRYSVRIKEARQGPRTWKETEQMADMVAERIGMNSGKFIRQLKSKTDNLDAYIEAARDTLNKSATELHAAIKKAAFDGTEEAFKRTQELWTMHAEIQAEVGGAASKIARSLNVHRKTSKAANKFGYVLSTFKDKEFTQEMLNALAKIDPSDTGAISKVVRDSVKPKFKDYFWGFFYNNILSGIPTHLVNIGSTGLWQATLTGPFRALRATADIPVSLIQGRQREYYFREILPSWVGTKRGLTRGLAKGLNVMKTGILEDATKLSREAGVKMSPFTHSPYKVFRKAAPALEVSTRALNAEDTVFKTMAFESEMYALATRQAIKSGLRKGKDIAQKAQEILSDPPQEMIEKAMFFADHATFTDAPGLWTRQALKLRNITPGGRFIVPFVNTIGNLLKRGVEMTPGMGIAMQRKARGAQVSDVVAKQAMGTMIAAYFAVKYVDGEITGGAPKEPAAREQFYREGKLPWAVRFGDKWIQFRRAEPYNTVGAIVATIGDKWRDEGEIPTEEAVAAVGLGIARNLLDAGYMSGMSDLIEALERGEQSPKSFLKFLPRYATGLIPYSGFQRSIAGAVEAAKGKATVKRIESTKDAIKAGTPVLSGEVAPRLNLWGDPIEREGGVVRQFLPWKYSTATKDPVDMEMGRLELYVGMPKQEIRGIKLTPEEHNQYIRDAGQAAKKKLDEIVAGSGWKSLPDEMKKKRIRSIIESERDRVSVRMYYEGGLREREKK